MFKNDLNPLEEAQGYQRLINDFLTIEKVSKFIGKVEVILQIVLEY